MLTLNIFGMEFICCKKLHLQKKSPQVNALVLTRLLQPTANPTAVLIKPSIPLAPLFPVTWTQWHGKPELNIKEAL